MSFWFNYEKIRKLNDFMGKQNVRKILKKFGGGEFIKI